MDDDNHFRYFAPDPPASIPEGTMEPLEFKTTAERVAERRAWLDSTETCQCCNGMGRVAKQPHEGMMKCFIWNNPYDVSYGSSLLFAIAETEEDARAQALKGRVCAYGEDYEHKQPSPANDWRKKIKLGKPDRVLDLPCAEWHEWSE